MNEAAGDQSLWAFLAELEAEHAAKGSKVSRKKDTKKSAQVSCVRNRQQDAHTFQKNQVHRWGR
jgi:hypothetical protein